MDTPARDGNLAETFAVMMTKVMHVPMSPAMVAKTQIRASRGADAAQELLGKCVDRLLVTDRWGAYSWVSTMGRQLLEEGRALPGRKVRGMCKYTLGLQEALCTFVDNEGVEPTNNAAERALRFAVLWRKGYFGSDSVGGSHFVEQILTVRATLHSQKRDLYAYLKDACTAALHGVTPPSILPIPEQHVTPLALAA